MKKKDRTIFQNIIIFELSMGTLLLRSIISVYNGNTRTIFNSKQVPNISLSCDNVKCRLRESFLFNVQNIMFIVCNIYIICNFVKINISAWHGYEFYGLTIHDNSIITLEKFNVHFVR